MKERAPLELPEVTIPASTYFDFQIVVILLAVITLTVGGAWVIIRTRERLRRRFSTEYVIFESEVSIDIGDEGLEIEYEDDVDGRLSMDMILNSASPRRMAFNIDKLPLLHIDRKPGNILERRGRKTLRLKPSQTSDADMAVVDIKDGRLTVSPYSSKKDAAKLITEFPPTRRRTLRLSELDLLSQSGVSTAPFMLQNSWRPLDTAELPEQGM